MRDCQSNGDYDLPPGSARLKFAVCIGNGIKRVHTIDQGPDLSAGGQYRDGFDFGLGSFQEAEIKSLIAQFHPRQASLNTHNGGEFAAQNGIKLLQMES